MPNLIQVADDLKNAPDAYLAQQMQSPSGTVPPWLVASEMQRRAKLREGAGKAQAPQSSVSQDLIKSLYARIPPTAGLSAPPGMPPVNLTPGSNPSTLGAPPGGTPPGNFKMPARTMADGGQYDEEEEPDLYELPQPSRRAQMDQLMMLPSVPPAAPMPSRAAIPAAPVPPAAAVPSGPTGSAARMAPENPILGMLQAAAQKYKLPPALLAAVAEQESGGNPKAVSPKGAIGVMQIMPATAGDYGVKNPRALLDPAVNIDVGARHLARLLQKFNGDPRLALAAYNAGEGAVQRHGGVPPYRETQGYTRNILDSVNGTRRGLGLPTPVDAAQLPSTADLIAQAAPPPAMAPQAAQAAVAPASYAARDEAANAATAAKPPRLNQVWQPPQPAEIADAQNQIKALQASHVSMQERQAALFSPENLDTLNTAAKVLIGERPDYSQYSGAIQKVMGIAEKNLHPSIGGVLMQFGLALMASPSHNVGQAIGQAGSIALQGYQEQKQQASKDYLAAINAGINLQDKTNDYDAKIGQYKMHRLDAQQRGIEFDERAYQQQLTGLHKDLTKAQNDFEKKTATPALKQSAATAYLNDHGAVLDPQLNDPYAQVGRDFGLEAQQSLTGTAKAATPKVDKVTERLTEYNKERELRGLPPVTNINSLPKADQDYITRGTKAAAIKPSIFDPVAGAAVQAPDAAVPGVPGVETPDVTPGVPAAPGAAEPGNKPAATPSTAVPLAPPTGGYNEKILEGMNDNARTLVKGIATYQIAPPTGTASKDPDWLKALVLAKQYDPSFDANQYKIRYDLMKDFSPGGKSGQNLLSAEQLVHHLERMRHSWEKLKNWSGMVGGLANAPYNWLQAAAHTPEMTAFEVDRKAVSDELMKYLRGSGAASEREAKDWEMRLSPNAPPESQASAMQELYGLLGARLKLSKDQFEATMGRPADFSAKFKPETVEILRKSGVDMGFPGAQARPEGGGTKLPASPPPQAVLDKMPVGEHSFRNGQRWRKNPDGSAQYLGGGQ